MGNLWKHDLRQGFEMNRVPLILCLLILNISFLLFWLELQTLLHWVGIEEPFTLGDAMWYLYEGTNFVPSKVAGERFELPIVWLFQLVFLHCMIGYYPLRDWQSCGIQVLLRTGSRKRWWGAKVLWVIAVNVLFLLLQLLVFGFLTLLAGGRLSLAPSMVAFSLGAGNLTAAEPFGAGKALSLLVGMPFVVQTALSLLQLMLMFLVGPLWAFTGIMGYELAATCLPSGLLLANYTMCRRAYGIVPFYDWGREKMAGCVMSLAIAAVSIFVGFYRIRKKDILPKGETEI